MDFHEVARVGPGLVADDDREHDTIVGIPRAAGSVGDRGIIAGRDAAPRARVRVTEGAVVDPHATPAHETPVDSGVAVIEERLPAGFDQREQSRLVGDVTLEGGEIPGNQVIGDGLPRAPDGNGVVGEAHARQRLEGGDRHFVDVADGEEPEEVGEYPGQSRVPRLSEPGDRGGVDFGFETGPDGFEVVDRGLFKWARWHVRCGRELVPEVISQDSALGRVQLDYTIVRLNPVRRLQLDNRPNTVDPLQLDDVLIRPTADSRLRPRNILLRLNAGGRFRPGNISIRSNAVGRLRLGDIRFRLHAIDRWRLGNIGIRPDRRRRGASRGLLGRVAARTGCDQERESDQKNTDAARVHATTLEAQARAAARRLEAGCALASNRFVGDLLPTPKPLKQSGGLGANRR